MNTTIYKYPLNPGMNGRSEIMLPQGAQILTVQTQRGEPQIWALVDPDAEKAAHFFYVAATGERFNIIGLTYIGTFQLHGGSLVFHLFEDHRE